MPIFIKKIFLLFIICKSVSAASYLSLSGGSFLQEIEVYDSEMNSEQAESNGNSFGIDAGHFLTNSLAAEVGYTSTKFERFKIVGTTPNAFEYKNDPELSIINFGFRWFIYDFLSIRYGGTKTEFNPRGEGLGGLSIENEVLREAYAYYGVGVAYNFKGLQLYYDYTVFSNVNAENPVSKKIGVRLFF